MILVFMVLLYVRKSCSNYVIHMWVTNCKEVEIVEFDTIAAISTPMGEGAIAIVRLSGDEAIEIADRIFRSPSGKRLIERTITYNPLWTFNRS